MLKAGDLLRVAALLRVGMSCGKAESSARMGFFVVFN